jgi:2-haloacid dehalogenase
MMPDVRPHAVVFDLGGVLVDWNPRHLYRRLFDDEAMMEHFLATVCTQAWNLEQDRGRQLSEGVALLQAQHPHEAARIAAFYGRWTEMLGGAIGGTVAILEELATARVPLFALTNWSAELFPHALERFEFLARFEGIVVSGQELLAKPDPRIYRLLIERYHVDAATAVFIDDAPRNVESARAIGFDAILFETPEQLRRALIEREILSIASAS